MNASVSNMEDSYTIADYYVVCTLSTILLMITMFLSVMILVLVRTTRPRLHTVRHLLICNTSVASLLYCIIQFYNYVFLIFIPWETSDVHCQWRGYLAYFGISAITYAFLIQALSRPFSSILSTKYKYLSTFKTHYILIIIQWFTVIIIPLPTLVTKDIYYRSNKLCWVLVKFYIHVTHTFIATYIFPAVATCVVYTSTYYQVKQVAKRAEIRVKKIKTENHDLEILRNIMILLCVYFLVGMPNIIFILTGRKVIYLASLVTTSFMVTVEKACTILLDRDIRQVIMILFNSDNRIQPFLDQSLNIQVRFENSDTRKQTIRW